MRQLKDEVPLETIIHENLGLITRFCTRTNFVDAWLRSGE